jgi:hypothetical protein
MGIEKEQLAAIDALFHGQKGFVPAASTMVGNFTPNQRALAAAISLAVKDAQGVARCRSLFAAMAINGHQAVGPGPGNEQGAPDPHSGLWAAAMGMILWAAHQQGNVTLANSAIAYWRDHMALLGEFWTPLGARLPCARAIYTLAKNDPGATASPIPSWTLDSRLYAAIVLGQAGNTAKEAYGNISPPDQLPYDIMVACEQYWPAIKQASLALRLGVPVRRWPASGGYLAAMTSDTPMNDRMSWCLVSDAGRIMQSSNTLANLPKPGAWGAYTLVGAPTGTYTIVTGGAPASPAPVTKPAVAAAPAVTVQSDTKLGLWGRFLAWLRGL